MTAQKWALRRSPTVEQEVFGPDKDGNHMGLVNGVWTMFGPDRGGSWPYDLVPLQTPPVKALRCWVNVGSDEHLGWPHASQKEALEGASTQVRVAVPMIERAPGDALAAASRAYLGEMKRQFPSGINTGEVQLRASLERELATYREATE